MSKRIISIILVFVMVLSFAPFVQAAEDGRYISEAEQLKSLGVFQGTDNGFELNREPTRLEGLVMLIRLLGKETEAQSLLNQNCIFTDVPDWGKGYANYAYSNGLTNGIGNNLFGSNDNINALAYTTFMLRALGYDDSNGDFSYNLSIQFAAQIGLYSNADTVELTENAFLRDHVAKISMLALNTTMKAGGISLLDKLSNDGSVSQDVARQIKTYLSSKLNVHFIDVGQADSILILKDNDAMLIDGGNKADADLIINYITSHNIRTLKYVVATHPHEDHIGGLSEVIRTFDVEKVIMPDVIATTQTFEHLLLAISDSDLKITRPVYGDTYELGNAIFEILAPNASSYTNINNYSIVIKLINGSNSFLFTGDAEELSESEMLAKDSGILKSDVLKIGHHGSDSSTSSAFLNSVSPQYAVITVGKGNDYGHPSENIMNRLADAGAIIYRTDKDGTIVFTSDGNKITVDKISTSDGNKEIVDKVDTPAAEDNAKEYEISNNEVDAIDETTSSASANVSISSVDKRAELVTIKNAGSTDVNLTGWKLVSVTGNQTFIFPSYILKSNETVTVASGGATGDLIWTSAHIWNNSSSDPAQLYDAQGNLIATFDS